MDKSSQLQLPALKQNLRSVEKHEMMHCHKLLFISFAPQIHYFLINKTSFINFVKYSESIAFDDPLME